MSKLVQPTNSERVEFAPRQWNVLHTTYSILLVLRAREKRTFFSCKLISEIQNSFPLYTEKDNFTKSLVKNLFAYALGRDVNFADEKEINNIVEEVKDDDYRFRTIIEQIVLSPSFYKKEESWFNKLVGG